MEGAWLEGHEGDDVGEIPGDLAERHRFGVRSIWNLRKAAGDDFPVSHEHTADGRVGPAVGKRLFAFLDGFAHEVAQLFVGVTAG
jgi:hypothetical protein